MLPIDPLLPEIVERLREHPSLVLVAPPGAGKTTRVPAAMLRAGYRRVLVLEPRRLAARLAAIRVAEEVGTAVGQDVGYQVRFDARLCVDTRLVFLTEGMLARWMQSDPTIAAVDAVVLDEFHERHLHTDVALALLRRLQLGPHRKLRIVVMSATMQTEPVAAFLGGCPVMRAESRAHSVDMQFLAQPDERPLEAQVATALRRLVDTSASGGDVLVFLPGIAEIRRAERACATLAETFALELATLHGDLPLAKQIQATRPGARRKVILSTNVAESSVTIEGVRVVVDSGLARVATHSPWSGLSQLQVQKISRASAEQRAGRAGRVAAGQCLRLYTRVDLESRPADLAPEIARADLAELLLWLHGWELGVSDLSWLQAPPPAHVQAAEALLRRLGALHAGRLSELGRRMLELPLHPRLACLVLEAAARGHHREGCIVAALLAERKVRRRRPCGITHDSDLLLDLNLYQSARRHNFSDSGLDEGYLHAVERTAHQVWALSPSLNVRDEAREGADEALLVATLLAFPDRVARRRLPGKPELLMSGGGSAKLDGDSVCDAAFMVAVDAEQRAGKTVVRAASAIKEDWLLEYCMDAMHETTETVWNATAQRVETVRRLEYDKLLLDETVQPATDDSLLREAARKAGAGAFMEQIALDRFMARASFAANLNGERALQESDVQAALDKLCQGRSSFAELRAAAAAGELLAHLRDMLGSRAAHLDRVAPEAISLPRRRRVTVHYEIGKPPWIASRLQDFFGLQHAPTVGEGKVALVLHLLAPNQRPVQVTSDLQGFWERTYPRVRKELSRKYPRHEWPEMGGNG